MAREDETVAYPDLEGFTESMGHNRRSGSPRRLGILFAVTAAIALVVFLIGLKLIGGADSQLDRAAAAKLGSSHSESRFTVPAQRSNGVNNQWEQAGYLFQKCQGQAQEQYPATCLLNAQAMKLYKSNHDQSFTEAAVDPVATLTVAMEKTAAAAREQVSKDNPNTLSALLAVQYAAGATPAESACQDCGTPPPPCEEMTVEAQGICFNNAYKKKYGPYISMSDKLKDKLSVNGIEGFLALLLTAGVILVLLGSWNPIGRSYKRLFTRR